jgi:tetratricopeptide (TPR) repeat protein
MKLLFISLVFALSLGLTVKAQNVGIGTSIPNANAALEIKSNSKGLLMPRLSTTARNSMTNVAKGMLVYDTSKAGFYYHDGGKWFPISQSNTDSLLRYTYPGVAPTILSMSLNGSDFSDDLYGTLYDNGGQAGNYASNSNDQVILSALGNDSAALFKVEVVQMNLESPYDSLEIYSDYDYEHKQVFTGNRTGTFYFKTNEFLHFKFRSNGANNLSGFKINWTVISTNSQIAEPPPLTGWYFNSAKIAGRVGVNSNNNWATENLGKYSFAFGQNADAKGDYSNALGRNNSAFGEYSTALGQNNSALGEYSTAIGTRNTALGRNSTAIGNDNTVIGYNSSTAIGNSNQVRGIAATAIGHDLIANVGNSFTIGYYNDSTVNAIFAIGNGIGNYNRSNAFTIKGDGNTGIGTTTPSTTLEVNGGFKTKYSGSVIKSVTGTGSAALVYVPITTLPSGWDFTNTLVMVSVADGISGVIYRTKLVTTSAIELVFEANATGPTRFNYIVFKL